MRVRTVIEEKIHGFQQVCPDMAQQVLEAYAQFARGESSPEDFAQVFNRADLYFWECKGKVPQKRERERKPKAIVEPLPPPPVQVPLERFKDPQVRQMVQHVYDYAYNTLMDAIRHVQRIKQPDHMVEEVGNVRQELDELARQEEVAFNKRAKKRERVEPTLEELNMKQTNETALDMIQSGRKMPQVRKRTAAAKQQPETRKLGKDVLIKALIHLKATDGVLGRSNAVLKRLTFGL